MRIRKPAIPSGVLAAGVGLDHRVAAAVAAPDVVASIRQAAIEAGHGRFTPRGTQYGLAIQALDALFNSGTDEASGILEAAAGEWLRDEEASDDFRRSQPFSAILDAVTDSVAATAVAATRGAIGAVAKEAILSSFLDEVARLDATKPSDLIRGTQVVVCHVPGFEGDMAATMTGHWTSESSSLTIKPDKAFARFLSLVNVGASDWIDAVRTLHGVSLDEPWGLCGWESERADAWRSFAFVADPSKPSFKNVLRLVDAVDACPYGFTPLVAFAADAGMLCSRDWDLPLSIEGGVIGLHDFMNGSGDPLRFEHAVTIPAGLSGMTLGEAVQHDFAEVHGFVRKSFRSKVSDLEAARSPALC